MKKNVWLILLLIFLILLGGYFLFLKNNSEINLKNIAEDCVRNSGEWLADYQECEYVNQEWCQSQGGIFNECGSACRHQEDSEGESIICTMQCVPICKFLASDYLSFDNISYSIEGRNIKLNNGLAEEDIFPDSATKVKTLLWEDYKIGDIDSNGLEDKGIVLVQDSGGTGSFYYLSLALQDQDGYKSTNSVFLGDRIVPQNINLIKDFLVFNYMDRSTEEPMNISPNQAQSRNFKFIDGNLKEISFKDDLIEVYDPAPKSYISSPLIVNGRARGNWFFEGDFPVVITNWDGLIIGEGIARAQEDSLTENFVNFIAEINFTQPDVDIKNEGFLILQKDNPSDLSTLDNALEIPIFFR